MWIAYKDFSSSFLEEHHEYVLCDVLHQIMAFLLFPLNCSCKPICLCEEEREEVVLSLNIERFNQAEDQGEDDLDTIRLLLRIPDDRVLRRTRGKAYPLWLIQEELKKREEENHFKIVDRLMWVLLRQGATYQELYKVRKGSLNEAVEMILGKTPLKTKVIELQNPDYLCGEKGYVAYFSKYKSVAHFISALELMRREESQGKKFTLSKIKPDQIERFLILAHWLRVKFLELETPNSKEKNLFSEEAIIPLPVWVNSNEIHIPIESYKDKIAEAYSKSVVVDPRLKVRNSEKK